MNVKLQDQENISICSGSWCRVHCLKHFLYHQRFIMKCHLK